MLCFCLHDNTTFSMTLIKNTYRCASIDIGVINLAFCVTDFIERYDGTFEFDLVQVERVKIGNMSDTIQCLGKKVILFYSSKDVLRDVNKLDFIFIEQQLSRAVKNIVLSHVTMAYFETKCLVRDRNNTKIVFVPPKNKFRAVKHAFERDVFSAINFERRGNELKKLSVDIARLLFTRFRVEVGLNALAQYRSKLDDVSDVFLQSFVFFLEMFPAKSTGGRSSFVGVEEDGQREHADEQT